MNRQRVEETTILRATVGSEMFGLNLTTSDRDEMGVCVEDMRSSVGFNEFTHLTLEANKGHELDLTIYGLKRYLSLCLKGNPTVLTLLFVPPSKCHQLTVYGSDLQNYIAPLVWSKRAGYAFLGYLKAQRQRLNNERGGKDVNRPELVEKYGFDTKYAMHMLRLGYQGLEYMESGVMTLPMREPERSFLLDVRTGGVSLNACTIITEQLERKLLDLVEHKSKAPKEPNSAAVEDWMLDVYYNSWKGRREK